MQAGQGKSLETLEFNMICCKCNYTDCSLDDANCFKFFVQPCHHVVQGNRSKPVVPEECIPLRLLEGIFCKLIAQP